MIVLFVYGHPAPQGSKRVLGRTSMGRVLIGDASDKTQPWRADVKAACERWLKLHQDFSPLDQAVIATMVFTFARPASVSRAKRPFMTTAPDLCKLARSTEDAISSSGMWADDKLVVEYERLAKVYAGEDPHALSRPGCFIQLRPKPMLAVAVPPIDVQLKELAA